MKRVLLILSVPITIWGVSAGIWISFLNPTLESWIQNKVIEITNDSSSPVLVKIGKVQVDLFYPRLAFQNIKFEWKTPQTKTAFEKLEIESVETKLNAFKLLTGNADISGILITRPSLRLNIDPLLDDKSESKEIPTELIFKTIQKLPISKIKIDDLQISVHSEQNPFEVMTDKLQVSVDKIKSRLFAQISSNTINITESHIGSIDLKLQTSIGIDKDNIRLQEVKIGGLGTEILIFGEIPHWKTLTTSPEIQLQPQIKTDLQELAKSSIVKKKLSKLEGTLESSSTLKLVNGKISANGEVRTQNLQIDEFNIGHAKIAATLKNDQLELSTVELKHPAGVANLDKFKMSLKSPMNFEGSINSKEFSIHELLKTVGVGEIPVWFTVASQINCKGQFESFQTQCEAFVSSPRLEIKTEMKQKQSLVDLEKIELQGQLQVDAKAVTYQGQVKIGQSKGSSKGTISFADGFRIEFETPQLFFSDIKNLANLKLEGVTSIKGHTEGDSSSATFTLDAEAKNFIIEKFKLGQLVTSMNYDKGELTLSRTSGAFNKTSYVGELLVDLNHSLIEGSFILPTIEIDDVNQILNHIYQLPFTVTGLGDGRIKFEGPLDFWNLNHQLQTKFRNISVAGERFDYMQFNSVAQNGRIDLSGSYLEKNKNKVVLQGGVLPGQKLDLFASALNFPLEQSDIISAITNAIFGKASFTTSVLGTLQNPVVNANGDIKETVVDEQEVPDSHIEFYADNLTLKSKFNFLGNKLKGHFIAPSSNHSSTPLKLNIKSDNLNFVSAMAIVTGATNLKDINSLITAELDLESPSGNIFKSSGSLYIPNLYLRRGNQYISHKDPLEVIFDRGNTQIKNLKLEGPGNNIEVTGSDFNVDNLKVNISAEADLRFAHILAPFLEDIGGPVRVNTSITGPITKPQIFGNAEVLNGFVKIKGFPHAFERIQSQVNFSQSKVTISSLKSAIAGGTLNGSGQIQIAGIKNIPMNISAKLENVKFNVPDKVRSTGNADVTFKGNWFPFVLSGTYRVDGAYVTKEFTESSSVTNIKQSAYLPKVLKQSNFDPVLLDLQVILEKNIVLKNSLADGSALGNLTVKGPPQNPGLLGRVEFNKNSKLTFKDKIFDIITGSATFKTVDDINPELFISAQSRIGDYDVSLLVQGQAKDPNFVLSSIPPLSESDLISLLALGVTSSNLEQNVQSKDQQTQTGYEIGAAIFSNNPLNKKLSETIGWNLKFTTAFDTTRNIAVPKIVAERKLSERLSATAGRTLDQGMVDLKLQYLLNTNISAIGTWEEKQSQETASDTASSNSRSGSSSIFGVDLEFKKEFK